MITMPLSDVQLIAIHRQLVIARLERAIEDELAREYEVLECGGGCDPVHPLGAKFCGDCGRRLVREE
jgi:hypothetical protein